MNTWLKACIGASLLLVGYVGIAYADGLGEPPVTAQQQGPVPCEVIDQVLVCGSPVAVPTEEPPTKTDDTLYITELPSTGVGTTAGQPASLHYGEGWHYQYTYCSLGRKYVYERYGWGNYYGDHTYTIFPGRSRLVGVCY
jgi:hypothetical protein